MLLAQEHGRTPYGDGKFRWEWSEDLIWPAVKTGKMATKRVPVPILGAGGGTEFVEISTPEYKPVRQTNKYRNQWIVTRWLSPEQLAGLQRGYDIGPEERPYSQQQIVDAWRAIFPHSDCPLRGLHFHTDWANKPDCLPSLEDTKLLIHQLRVQRSDVSPAMLLLDMDAEDFAEKEKKRILTESIVEECFTAFLNPEPGKRGGSISFGGSELNPSSVKGV